MTTPTDTPRTNAFPTPAVERAVNEALNPRGMSSHSGKVTLDCSHVTAILSRSRELERELAAARAALSLPETQGEPVAGDVEWLHKFINCTPFGADAPAEDMQRAHRIVDSLYAAPPSQPAQAKPTNGEGA